MCVFVVYVCIREGVTGRFDGVESTLSVHLLQS